MQLEDISIHAWIQEHSIKNEKGDPIEFKNHMYLFDIYSDMSPHLVIYKAAQVGLSVLQIIKSIYIVGKKGLDVIYTMPTDADAATLVDGKVNRIIKQNAILQKYTKDKDTIEKKRVNDGMIYFRGTFSKRAAISVTSDLNIHDEEDFSDQEIVGDYESRLQHSKYKWDWHFGHPSTVGVGVSNYWDKSDQKHWFIKCEHCKKWHYMEWPKSVCQETELFICKLCKKPISDDTRRHGKWVSRFKLGSVRIDKKDGKKVKIKYSGYWIPLLIAPWISASYIIEKYYDKSEEYFYNRVLGLPYVGSGNKVTQDIIMRNLTSELNLQKGKIVIGIDTGTYLRFVCGNDDGIFHYGEENGKGASVVGMTDEQKKKAIHDYKYLQIEKLLKRWPNSIAVFDQGGGPGDGTSVRELKEKYPGRVFIAFYREDRKNLEIVKWDDEEHVVVIDRNKAIQLVIDEFADSRIPLYGSEAEFWNYWLHWDKIYRVAIETPLQTIKYKWLRSGRDDWVHATIYWRTGMSRFAHAEGGQLIEGEEKEIPLSPEIQPDGTGLHSPNGLGTLKISENNWRIN